MSGDLGVMLPRHQLIDLLGAMTGRSRQKALDGFLADVVVNRVSFDELTVSLREQRLWQWLLSRRPKRSKLVTWSAVIVALPLSR
jgi:hypothetical protein